MRGPAQVLVRLLYRSQEHKGAIFYTASSVSKTAAQFLAGLVTVRVVAPAELGIWNSIALATTYALFLQAGIINGLNRELPFTLGSGDKRGAERLAGTAQSFSLLGSSVALLVGLCSLFVFRDKSQAVLLAIAVEIVVVLCFFYQNYLTVTFRSKGSFTSLALAEFVSAFLGLLLLPLVFFFRYQGMLLRIAFVSVIAVGLLHLVRPMRIKPMWDAASFKVLMKTGLPIFLLSYVELTCSTFDRLFLLRQGGVEQVGFYALALMVRQAMMVVPSSIGIYMYPRMTHAWAKHKDKNALWVSAWKTSAVVVLIMLPMVIGALLTIPWLVTSLFPMYTPGIVAAQIMAVAALFNGAAMGVNAIWSLKAWKFMVGYQLGGAGLRVVCPLLGVLICASPILGVAWGMLIAYLIQFLLSLVLTYAATHGGGERAGIPVHERH